MGNGGPHDVPWWRSKRYLMLLMVSLACFFHNMLRVTFGIAIVCMVKTPPVNTSLHVQPMRTAVSLNTSLHNPIDGRVSSTQYLQSTTMYLNHSRSDWFEHQSGDVSVDSELFTENSSKLEYIVQRYGFEHEFLWDKELRGILLGASFWGYLLLQIPGGWLSERYGAKLVVGVAFSPLILTTLLSPVAARASPYVLLVARVIVGASCSVFFPSIPIFWAKWSPPGEWMRMLGVTLAGGEVGNALSFPVGGVLCRYGFDGGWPSVFYVTGIAGLLWLIGWIVLVRDCPEDVPGITEKERKYLESVLNKRATSRKSQRTPWILMLTSRPCVALMVTHVTANFFNYMMLTHIPTYMKEVLNFDISANGFYSMLPYVGLCIVINVASFMSDCLMNSKLISLDCTRKLMNTIGMVVPGLFILGLSQLDSEQQTLGVALLCGAVASFGFCFSGHITNFADIAVVHAGTLSGVSNTMATVPGILAPYIVALVTKEGTRAEWQLVFYSAAVVLFIGALVFLLFGSGTPQPWAIPGGVECTTYIEAEREPECTEMLESRGLNITADEKNSACLENMI